MIWDILEVDEQIIFIRWYFLIQGLHHFQLLWGMKLKISQSMNASVYNFGDNIKIKISRYDQFRNPRQRDLKIGQTSLSSNKVKWGWVLIYEMYPGDLWSFTSIDLLLFYSWFNIEQPWTNYSTNKEYSSKWYLEISWDQRIFKKVWRGNTGSGF